MNSRTNKKNRWLHIRLTEDEYLTLHRRSGQTAGATLSDYARRLIFSEPVTFLQRNQSTEDLIKELINLRNDLNKVGNNFNQVVRRINQFNSSGNLALWRRSSEVLQQELLERVDFIKDVIGKMADKWLFE